MNKSSRVLALKIAQIIEEYTDREIVEAIALLENYGAGKQIVRFLSERAESVEQGESVQRRAPSRSVRSVEDASSRAVLLAKDEDPEKFEVLNAFDKLIRSGRILRSNESLRRFGEQLSKGFEYKKSRRESIGSVLTALSEHKLEDIRKYIEYAVDISERRSGDGYQDLANFLIKGKSEE